MSKQLHALTFFLLFLINGVCAQQDTVRLFLRPNVTQESIQLRWMVNSPDAWYSTNSKGVIIERYILMRSEEGLASDTIQGQGKSKLIHVPHITRITPNGSVDVGVEWEFEESGNNEIQDMNTCLSSKTSKEGYSCTNQS